MKDHSSKFIFLIVVTLVVLFSRIAYPAGSATGMAEVTKAKGSAVQSVPFFVMPSPTVSASDGEQTQTSTPEVLGASVTAPPPPTLSDAASLVADLTTGAVYEQLNPDKRWPTASITKLMTATIVADKLDPTTKITITEPMFAVDPTEETLVLGETYTVADLMKVMLLPSSNVAAQALADFYGETSFLQEMNARAAAWGMTNTYFGDPSGLSATNESTANDFLKLAQEVYNHYPQIFTTTRTPQTYITEQNSGKKILVKSINNFAGEPDFIGGKTGHTNEADGNLLSIFSYENKPVFILVLGTDDRFGDTQKLYAWFKANFK